MHCTIYKSLKKPDTYLYLAQKDDFSSVPDVLLKLFAEPVFVMELELTPTRRLAQENVQEVMRCLQEKGWFLQVPHKDDPERMH